MDLRSIYANHPASPLDPPPDPSRVEEIRNSSMPGNLCRIFGVLFLLLGLFMLSPLAVRRSSGLGLAIVVGGAGLWFLGEYLLKSRVAILRLHPGGIEFPRERYPSVRWSDIQDLGLRTINVIGGGGPVDYLGIKLRPEAKPPGWGPNLPALVRKAMEMGGWDFDLVFHGQGLDRPVPHILEEMDARMRAAPPVPASAPGHAAPTPGPPPQPSPMPGVPGHQVPPGTPAGSLPGLAQTAAPDPHALPQPPPGPPPRGAGAQVVLRVCAVFLFLLGLLTLLVTAGMGAGALQASSVAMPGDLREMERGAPLPDKHLDLGRHLALYQVGVPWPPDPGARRRRVFYPALSADHPQAQAGSTLTRDQARTLEGVVFLVGSPALRKPEPLPGSPVWRDTASGMVRSAHLLPSSQRKAFQEAFPKLDLEKVHLLQEGQTPPHPFFVLLTLGISLGMLYGGYRVWKL